MHKIKYVLAFILSVFTLAISAQHYVKVLQLLNGEEMVNYHILPNDVDYITFSKIPYCDVNVISSDTTMGRAEASLSSVKPGSTVDIKAYSNPGYVFVDWYYNGSFLSSDNPYNTQVDVNSTYVANFKLNDDLKEGVDMGLSVKWATCNVGSTSPEMPGNYYRWGDTEVCKEYLPYNPSVDPDVVKKLSLDNDAVYQNWAGEWRMPTYEEYKELMDKTKCVWSAAYLGNNLCTKITSKITGNSIYLPIAGKYDGTNLCEFGYTGYYYLADDMRFMYLTSYGSHGEGSGSIGNGYTVRGVCPYEKYDVSYRIYTKVEPSNVGSATVSSSYIKPGESVVLTAKLTNNNYRFVNWTLNGEVVSTDSICTVTPTSDSEYVAKFESKPLCYVSAKPFVSNMGTATSSSGAVYEGNSVTLTATAASDFRFVGWSVNGVEVSKENPYTTTITERTDFVANFEYTPYNEISVVDLQLPSGVKWASCNLGATSYDEYGDFFIWGELFPRTDLGSGFTDFGLSTYTETPDVLPDSADVAHKVLGDGWRIPTKEDFEELIANCTTSVVEYSDTIKLVRFKGKNGKSIYLPITPNLISGSEPQVNSWSWYRSSSIDPEDLTCSYAMNIWGYTSQGTHASVAKGIYRRWALPIRPVKFK